MKKFLNRDQIKYMAIILMLMDHLIQVFPVCSGYVYEALDGLSHFTFVAMAYFLVDGFYFTRSRKAYAIRLLIFGLVSQLPYMLAFGGNNILDFPGFNIGFSLLIGFLMIWRLETGKNLFINILVVTVTIVFSMVCDWFFLGQLVILIFYYIKKKEWKSSIAFIVICLMIGLFKAGNYLFIGALTEALITFACTCWGVVILGVLICNFYNGKKMEKHQKLNRNFFYVFYPLHLLIIGIIRIVFFM